MILNTDINFSMLPQLQVFPPDISLSAIETLPDAFSWAIILSDDSTALKNKKKLITKPKSQYSCGSCYAMATATCISDVFVVSGLKWNPEISTTYLMQNFETMNGRKVQNKCQGGNPAVLLRAIEQSDGSASDRCVDYSWCASNAFCSTNQKDLKGNRLRDYLNTVITPKGCFFSTHENGEPIIRNVYKIKNVKTLPYEEDVFSQNFLKKTIHDNGPIIMGFLTHNNFLDGNFNKTGGIYFYNGNYNPSQKDKFYTQLSAPTEKHAVVVVGWGVVYTDVDNLGNQKPVPYWHCRNTFGPAWGDNGYFKYAAYPYNEKIRVRGLGGYLFFEASNISTKYFESTTDAPSSFQKNKNYYQQNDDTIGGIVDNEGGVDKNKIVLGAGLSVLFLIVMWKIL